MTLFRGLWPVGLLLLLCVGCARASLRGAVAIEDSRALAGSAREQLVPSDCRDLRNAPAEPPALRIQRVVLSDGREALLELRAGYDTVVVMNAHDEARGRVFQYVSDDGGHGKILHTLLITPTVPGPRMQLADSFELQGSEAEFRASARQSILSCALISSEPPRAAATRTAAEPPTDSR